MEKKVRITKQNKLTKSKNLVVRVTEPVYKFVDEKSKEYGLTKTEYIFGQMNEESELIEYIREVIDPELERELVRLKKANEDMKGEMKVLVDKFLGKLEKSDESEFVEFYKEETQPHVKRRMRTLAKKRNISLQ